MEVILHEEEISSTQLRQLFKEFDLQVANFWLEAQNLDNEDCSYVISKIKEDK